MAGRSDKLVHGYLRSISKLFNSFNLSVQWQVGRSDKLVEVYLRSIGKFVNVWAGAGR